MKHASSLVGGGNEGQGRSVNGISEIGSAVSGPEGFLFGWIVEVELDGLGTGGLPFEILRCALASDVDAFAVLDNLEDDFGRPIGFSVFAFPVADEGGRRS